MAKAEGIASAEARMVKRPRSVGGLGGLLVIWFSSFFRQLVFVIPLRVLRACVVSMRHDPGTRGQLGSVVRQYLRATTNWSGATLHVIFFGGGP
jgi:hypothetical protein